MGEKSCSKFLSTWRITHQDIEGIVISTPAEMHYVVARESLLVGKHVFVEKNHWYLLKSKPRRL